MRLLSNFVLCLLTGLVLGSLLLGASCQPDSCIAGETRCDLNRAQICGSDQNWRDNLNCDELGGETVNWTCCWLPEDLDGGIPAGHSCLPALSCPDGGF
jgi:hypothetical protein